MHLVDWKKVEWVILDMDGTILDLAYDNYFWRELVPERYARKHGMSLEAAKVELTPKFAAVAHTLPWYCTDYWSGVTGVNMAALKYEVRERIRVLPGAEDFLHAVRASGRKLWLATNAHRDSWTLKLSQVGLEHLFDKVISSHDYGAPKEDQRFWNAFREQHCFDSACSLFVDDSLPVLRAARIFQIAEVVAITQPDSNQDRQEITEFPAVARLGDLLPITTADA